MLNPVIFQHLLRGGATGRGKVVVGTKPEDKTKDPVDIKAAVFFDGTFNNRANVSLARANPGASTVVRGTERVLVSTGRTAHWVERPKVINLKGGSYDRFYSNVAIMESMNDIQDEETQVSVYIEGIGTLDYEKEDTVQGGALGTGPTGVPAKVTRGIIELSAEIGTLLKNTNKRLGHLKVDVYGFSRGAAAARHFVARRTGAFFPKLINLAGKLGVPPASITVNFVGLYDTVSSYGGITWTSDLLKLFDDDVPQLHLNIAGNAKRVVQLAAGDEYRAKFSGTNIDSSVHAGVGYQCTIPGEHSDVGGGHKDGEVEKVNVWKAERDHLVESGWFTGQQLPAPGPPPPPIYYPGPMPGLMPVYSLSFATGQRTVHGGYQFIPLSLMMALAKKQGATFKGFTQGFAKYKVPAPLQSLYALMRASVVDKQEPQFSLPRNLYWVRNQYLHRSAEDSFPASIVSGSRKVNGRPQRQTISDAG